MSQQIGDRLEVRRDCLPLWELTDFESDTHDSHVALTRSSLLGVCPAGLLSSGRRFWDLVWFRGVVPVEPQVPPGEICQAELSSSVTRSFLLCSRSATSAATTPAFTSRVTVFRKSNDFACVASLKRPFARMWTTRASFTLRPFR